MVSEIIKASSVPLAIIVVGFIMWQAMKMGINGVLLAGGLGVIGGLAGYKIKTAVDKVKPKTPPIEK